MPIVYQGSTPIVFNGPQGVAGSGVLCGAISLWPTNNLPDGWLWCDGTDVSRTTYSDLFNIIGTTYGSGNGSTTFTLPNMKSRVAVGRDASATEFDVLGETGGAKTHTLGIPEIPSHSHNIMTASGGHTASTIYPGGVASYVFGFTPTTVNGTNGYGVNWYADWVGGGGAHNNLQPYIVLNYIIHYRPDGDPVAGEAGPPAIWSGTQAEYDAIADKDPELIYIINDGDDYGLLPAGGDAGSILTKVTGSDYDAQWVSYSSVFSPFENLLINGDFDIWQRGTSFSASGGGYTADRWKVSTNASTTWSLARSAQLNDQYGRYGAILTLAAKGGDFSDLCLAQTLESINCCKLQGKKITFSAVLSRNTTLNAGGFKLVAYTGTGIDESFCQTGRVVNELIIPYSSISTTGYSQHSLTITVPADAKQVCVLLRYLVDSPAGSAITIRRCQLTVSDRSVDCKIRSFNEELILCQRYYEKSYDVDTVPGTNTTVGYFVFNGSSDSGCLIFFTIPFKVNKRKTSGTVKFYQNTGTADVWSYAKNGTNGTATPTITSIAEGSMTANINTGSAWAVAQIWGNWTIDVEL